MLELFPVLIYWRPKKNIFIYLFKQSSSNGNIISRFNKIYFQCNIN